ncbi:hypothetical protein [Rheinheimera soli]|uniref:Carboxypeptidase regulatory-like domain-containing protein n=1 Tax=Rheinheimera soli TaxID=443616 RepID=A0ABU1VTX0_9GAMM|nr:hypothetical protein [Rheinheimera soli]MDR7119167.1 hypothetical protein [Rheinheimera soli]
MKFRPKDTFCQKSSLVVAVACLSIHPASVAQTTDGKAALQDPQFRQALQRLIKKYKTAEQNTAVTQKDDKTLNSAKLVSQPSNSEVNTEPGLVSTSSSVGGVDNFDNSQNSDSADFYQDNEFSGALVEGSRFAEGEELILGLEIASKNDVAALADVFAFKTKTSATVGFATLIQLLELPIEISSDLKRANGWLYNESNKFSMAVSEDGTMQVSLGGQTRILTEQSYSVESDDIYIDLNAIAEWLGFKYVIDESRLKLTLTTSRQLPVELRLARRGREVKNTSYNNTSVMPYRETGYKVFSQPLFDAQVSASHRGSKTTSTHSVLGSHDLAYLTSRYYLSGNNDDLLSSARLTFSRESDKNNLLGPLKATEFEFGDILPVGSIRGASRNLGRGLRFSNTPLVSSVDGRQIDLTGDVPDGWDVEVYRNGILIGQQFGINNGRYEFNEINLDFGENNFELVFYGPQGQVETKTEVFNVDSNSVGQGQFNYQFSVVEANKSVFALEEDNFGADESDQGIQANVVSGYGLFDWLSLSTAVGSFKPEVGEELLSYDLGLNLNIFGNALLSSSLGEVKDSLRTSSHSLRTQVLGNAVSLGYQNNDPIGDRIENQNQASDSLLASMAGRLFGRSDMPLSYQNEWRRDKDFSGTTEILRNSLGVNTKIGSFGNTLEWRKQTELTSLQPSPVISDFFDQAAYAQQLLERLEQQQQQQLTGEVDLPKVTSGGFQYRKNFNSVFTRFFANYNLKPDSEFTSYGVSLSYPFSPDLTSNFSIFRYTLTDQTSANLGLNWRLDNVYLSATTSYNNLNGWSGGLNARFGFGYGNESGYFSSSSNVAQAGAVSARVFEDKNLNGVMDEGETPIKNAKIMSLQGGSRDVVTNEKGIAVLTGLAANQKTDIVVDRGSFEDPTMKTLIPGVALTGRKGYIEHIDFAVTSTGELEGTLYSGSEDGDMEPAAYAVIQLIDSNGKVVDTAQSEYDGYYLFVDVVPGQYKVMIDKSFTKRRNLRLSDPVYLAVRGGDVINGTDIMLQQKEAAGGYSADMGSFGSLTVLKAYWGLLVRSGMNVAKLRPFYLQDEESGKYVLRAGFFKEQYLAEEVCNRIKGRRLACAVNQFETKL